MKKSKGFTLIELMVVVAIMGIIGSIGTLTIIKALPGYQLKKAASEMVDNLRKARTMAIKLNRSVVVFVNVSAGYYVLDVGDPKLGCLNRRIPGIGSIGQYYGGGVAFGYPGRTNSWNFTYYGPDAGTYTTSTFTIIFNPTGLTSSGMVGYGYLQNRNSNTTGAGYRVGFSSFAANIKMDQCKSKDSNGLTITCLE